MHLALGETSERDRYIAEFEAGTLLHPHDFIDMSSVDESKCVCAKTGFEIGGVEAGLGLLKLRSCNPSPLFQVINEDHRAMIIPKPAPRKPVMTGYLQLWRASLEFRL